MTPPKRPRHRAGRHAVVAGLGACLTLLLLGCGGDAAEDPRGAEDPTDAEIADRNAAPAGGTADDPSDSRKT